MEPELSATVKDITALSAVSERTAKRRLAMLKRSRSHLSLKVYCKAYGVDFTHAGHYVFAKRYEPLSCTRRERTEKPPYSFQISTWEQKYISASQNVNLCFCQWVLSDTDAITPVGEMRYFTLPAEALDVGPN
ncbi:MAG: hypothetical protein ABR574_07740 [Cryomorphaceae bacterium]|nr:hypothetical protein [Flavobacteriales bacterium]